MTDKSREAIDLAIESKQLLENPILNRWWGDAEKHLLAHLRATSPSNEKRVAELHSLIVAITKMKKDIHSYVHKGQRAATKIGNKTLAEKLKLK